ncbi:MAG: 4Fe-4S binding protein [Syntrophaceae bacterium]|nr:4Fe-4S binding protein [Syntrophaceae bacterium]
MIANYGFKDGSGDWFITIDTDRCNGCGKCANVCPAKILEIGPDEIDVSREESVAFIKHEERKKIRYACAPCKPGYGRKPPACVEVCQPGAISHSEGWKLMHGRSEQTQ